MSSTAEPKAPPTNRAGLTVKEYGGLKSTLCVGCGHDVITRQITQAFFEMGVAPYKVAKMSGIEPARGRLVLPLARELCGHVDRLLDLAEALAALLGEHGGEETVLGAA